MKDIIIYINRRIKRQIGYCDVPKSLLLLIFLISFLGGIFLMNLCLEGEFLRLGFVVIGGMGFLKLVWKRDGRVIFALLLGLILGGVRFYFAVQVSGDDISNYSGKIVLKGCVAEEVDVRADKIKYTIGVEEVEVDGGWQEVDGKVLVSADRYPVYEYGDCFLVKGKLQRPEKIEDFAYDKYLSRYRIGAVIYRGSISKIEGDDGGDFGGGGWLFFSSIYNFKGNFEARLSEIFAEPYSGFMAGLILGSRRGISQELTDKFNTTGLSHIVAVSGYNITMLIVVVSGLFGFLSRKRKVVFSIFVIFVFVILVGAGASVVRAAVMGVVGLLALWFGRSYFVGISLFSAAFFMNLINPLILLYDVGFQLSFLATCGLVYVAPLIEKYFVKLPEFFGIRESMTMTISAQVLALPIILLNFGRLSLIAPLANIFVLPFIPAAMLFGFFAVVFSYFWNFLGMIFGFVGYLILALIILLVEFFADVPFAAVNMEWFNWWLAGIYYLMVVWWIVKKTLGCNNFDG